MTRKSRLLRGRPSSPRVLPEIDQKPSWRDIQGWTHCENLYKVMVRDAEPNSHFVEVGCWKGRSAALMGSLISNSYKSIRFDCVDHWLGSPGLRPDDPDLPKLYEVFLQNIEPWKQWINPIRLPSIEASLRYPSHSLDFVYLDAGHDYESVKADLKAWRPKLKYGGILAGDDWRMSDVSRAVMEEERVFISVFGKGKEQIWLCRV